VNGHASVEQSRVRLFLAEILGDEQIDLTRLKKQAQLSQTQIPKFPRVSRTLSTLDSVLKILEEHGRSSKSHIDQLIQSVEQEKHQLTRVILVVRRCRSMNSRRCRSFVRSFTEAIARVSSCVPETASAHGVVAKLEGMLLSIRANVEWRTDDVPRVSTDEYATRLDRSSEARPEGMHSSQSLSNV
jgi:hypothetical protein